MPPTYRIAAQLERDNAAQPRRTSILIPATASMVLGVGLFFLGPFEFPGIATFQLDGASKNEIAAKGPTSIQFQSVQQELAEYMSVQHSIGNSPGSLLRWEINSANSHTLSLKVVFTSLTDSNDRLRNIVDGFLTHLKEVGQKRKRIPSQGEEILSKYVGELESRAEATSRLAEQAAAALPASDPRIDRNALLERWKILRGDLQSRRDQLRDAAGEIDRLQNEMIPENGIVTSQERKAAIEADATLTEDLRELSVRLTEVKRLMQKVDEDSRDSLDGVNKASDELASSISNTNHALLDRSTNDLLDLLQKDVTGFVTALSAFADQWRSAFRGINETPVDNQSSALLDQHLRLENLLSSMLFDSGKRLTAIRTQISSLEQSPSNDARHHVLISELTHDFQAMQASFHRFEFSAGMIDARNNFRLDAALRAARGLHRRTQESINDIEKTLAKQAGERARKEHALATARASEHLTQLRAASDQSIDQLLKAQDGINNAEDVNENFARAALRAELAASHARAAKDDLERARNQLQTLTSQRMNSDISEGVTLASCTVDSRPSNLLDRTWTSALAAMCAFVMVFAAQVWANRAQV